MKRKSRLSMASRDAWTARAFLLPFYLGVIFFFLRPIIQSLTFVFSNVEVNVGGYETSWTGIDNLKQVLTVDVYFSTNTISSVLSTMIQVPIILIISLFLAMLLNQKFIGRTFIRAVFFLPVIIMSGVVASIIRGDVLASAVLTGNTVSDGSIVSSSSLQDLLIRTGLNERMVSFFSYLSNHMFDMLWKTGIQMILFLAGLQGISPSLYEASAVEGATAWENFWKITIPMLSTTILVNVVYTIVDGFTDTGNSVIAQIQKNTKELRIGWAAAMTWFYTALIAVVLTIVFVVAARMNKSGRIKE